MARNIFTADHLTAILNAASHRMRQLIETTDGDPDERNVEILALQDAVDALLADERRRRDAVAKDRAEREQEFWDRE